MKHLCLRFAWVALVLGLVLMGPITTPARAQLDAHELDSGGLDSSGIYVAVVPPRPAGVDAEGAPVRVVTLDEALSVLAERHGVSFLYQAEAVAGKQAVLSEPPSGSLAAALARILKPHALSFAAIGERSYVVMNAARSVTPLKAMPPEAEGGRARALVQYTSAMLQARPLQTGTIAGTVVDSTTGEPLPGVNVVIAGTQRGASTGAEGHFMISELEPGAYDLVASFIGYTTKRVNDVTVAADDTTRVSIALNQARLGLDEVVVIGYGTIEKSSRTAAISKVENEKLAQIPVGSTASALVGRMAGVNISQARNRPGSSPTITIRGPGSISASNDPLIVIDGFPGGSLDDINMYNVESIEVLKDASAAAIYGSRGAGGVIIVTTKKGRSGQTPQVNFNAYYGMSYPIKYNDWINGGQEFYDFYIRYRNRELAWDGGDPSKSEVWGDPSRPVNYRVNPVIAEGSWNWEDILLAPAPIQNYNLSVRGGTDDVTYYVSGSYKDQQGMVRNIAWYRQYSVRANVNVDISPTVTAGLRLNPSYSKQRQRPGGINGMIKAPPFLSPERQEDGTYLRPLDYWGRSVSAMVNPLAELKGHHYYSTSFNTLGQMFAEITILDGLSLRSSVAVNIALSSYDNFREASASGTNTTAGSAGDARNINWITEHVLKYDGTFGDVHDLTGLLGASYQRNRGRSTGISAIPGSYANEKIWTLNNAVAQPSSSTFKSQWGLASYFTRLKYGYDDKYLLSASIRTDGSSRFGPENRWGFFPSASAAWRISEEGFMQDISVISELKLRASYGVTGNFNIGNFQYLGLIGNTTYTTNGELTQGQLQTSLGNPGLKWEKTESYDVGLEVGLVNNRINIVFDYYSKRTRDLLYNVGVPAVSGFTQTLVNIGDIRNRGIELELNTINLAGPFEWETSFSLSRNWNKVVAIGGGVDEVINTDRFGMAWLLREGAPMFSYYGYRQVGVIETKEELKNAPIMSGQVLGTIRYDDVNGDGEITPEDRVILGNFMPDYKLGMVNEFSWNNLDMSIVIRAELGAKIYNFENEYYQGQVSCAIRHPLVEHQWWSEENPGDGHTPAISLSKLEYVSNSDYYIEPADFLSIESINLGYTLPESFVNDIHLTNLRVYASMTNVVVLTKSGFHAYNPEGYTGGGINGLYSKPGYNTGSEPLGRTIALGVNVTF